MSISSVSVKDKIRQCVSVLLRMLIEPVEALNTSALVLLERISPNASVDLITPLQTINQAAGDLRKKIKHLYNSIESELEVYSPTKTAFQIRQKVLEWEILENVIANAIAQIRRIREQGVRLDDLSLDDILGEGILNAFWQLVRMLDFMSVIEGKELVHGGSRRAIRLERPFESRRKEAARRYSIESTARFLVYEPVWVLGDMLVGSNALRQNASQEMRFAIEAIGRYSGSLQDEIMRFGDAFLQEKDISAEEAASRLRAQVKQWQAYEQELAEAVQQIRQALAGGMQVDEDTRAIVEGAFFDAFDHLQRVLRRLENIQPEDF